MVKRFIPPFPLNGHIFAYGRTDAGKTWKLISVLQFYHSKKYKIWDLWGGKRNEGGFWCFPSDEKRLWFEFRNKVGEMLGEGPKKYNVNLMYPFLIDQIPKQLPRKAPRIIPKLFTIYFKDVGIDEISTVTGALSKVAQGVWRQLKKELPDDANGEDILEWFEKDKNKKHKRLTFYNSFIVPFCEEKILMGKNFNYNLDLISEAKDVETITILMDDYTPEEFKMFFILHFMSNIRTKGEKDIIDRKNLGIFRELNYFMKVQDESSQDGEQKQIMRNHFSEIARYGRSSFLIAGDTQSPSEVKGLVEGQDDLLLLNEMPSPTDRERTCDHLIHDGRMSPQQRDYLGSVEMTKDEDGKPNYKGKMVVVGRGKMAELYRRIQPPRTKCFKRSDGSFNKVWKKLYNEYENTNKYKQLVKDSYLLRKEKILIPKKEMKKNISVEYVPQEQIITREENVRLLELKRKQLKDLENSQLIA